ncbi:MAG: metalloregulator ArsR/SmtB family transcription factor [Elusimicrobia bacterium]|nr:metalloregulator ArsR/SmtB family transcription factor [Elusimicrobiota bacterium]
MAHIKINDLTSFHGALNDPLRLRLLRLLMERELCVCEMMRVLKTPQYKVSRHLGVLKKAGLIRDWREGTWIHYEIAPAIPGVLKESLVCLRSLWDQSSVIKHDLRILGRSSARKPGEPVVNC